MKYLLRIAIIITASLLIGVIYNQLYPKGIHWQYLFTGSSERESSVAIIMADSVFILLSDPGTLVIDTRSLEDYQLDHLPNAQHVPLESLVQQSKSILAGEYTHLIFYDHDGKIEDLHFYMAPLVRQRNLHYYILFGGFMSWLEKGYPVEEGHLDEN